MKKIGNGMKTAWKESWSLMRRPLLGMVLCTVFMLLFQADLRAYAIEHTRSFLSVVLGVMALFFGLIFAAQLVLLWVRAEKKEEDKV